VVTTWRISLSIEETYNRYYHKGRLETSPVNSVIVVNIYTLFHFKLANLEICRPYLAYVRDSRPYG
jgi:hypothetical protein